MFTFSFFFNKDEEDAVAKVSDPTMGSAVAPNNFFSIFSPIFERALFAAEVSPMRKEERKRTQDSIWILGYGPKRYMDQRKVKEFNNLRLYKIC